MEMKRKLLKVRKYKAGYEIRTELVDDSEYGGTGFEMKSAYTPDGNYIGNSKWGYSLCNKRGIKPELVSQDHNVCSIGFCEKEQKWYGWSHRAMFGFGIGSTCKKGDCGYTPATVDELYCETTTPDESGYAWVSDKDRVEKLDNGIRIRHDMVEYPKYPGDTPLVDPDAKLPDPIPAPPSYHTIETGRGEWTATTIEEAKQMAIDFASGVS